MIKNILAVAAVTICCIGAAEVPGIQSAEARRVSCWYEKGFFVRWGCDAVGKTSDGQTLMVCCN